MAGGLKASATNLVVGSDLGTGASDQDAPAFAGTGQLHTESSPNNSRDPTAKCDRKDIHNGPAQG